jgi:hypothetical protein
MVTERYEELIDYLASCNGTGRKELDQKIAAGEINKDDAQLVFYYASIKKLNRKLDNIARKVPSTI